MPHLSRLGGAHRRRAARTPAGTTPRRGHYRVLLPIVSIPPELDFGREKGGRRKILPPGSHIYQNYTRTPPRGGVSQMPSVGIQRGGNMGSLFDVM